MDKYSVTVRMENGDTSVRTLSLVETEEMLQELFNPESSMTTFVVNKMNPIPLRDRAMQKRSRR